MKQGWEIKKLGDVCISLEDGDWIEKKNQSNDGIRLIQTGNIGCGFYKDKSEKAKYISEDTFCALKCTEVIAGDILISRLPEPVGRACIIPHLGIKCITAVDCSIVKLNPNVILASWFIYYTQSVEYTAKVVSECSGTTRDRISRKKLSVITVPIPPLEEQKRIVEILDREFEKIDALKENAEKNLQHAKDLFQSALKQELQPKEGWTVKHLEKISTFSQGVQVEIGKQSTEKQDGYMRFLRIVDFTKGNEPPRYVGITDEKYQVKYDSLSVVRYGASAGFICTGLEGVIANNIFRIVPKKDILIGNTYLYYVLISDIFQSVIRDSVNGAAMPAISFGMIKNIDIPYPSIDEQQSIVVRLDKLREHCKALEENYTKTIALCDDMKQALLRKAFNGEL